MALKFGSNEVNNLKWGARNVLAIKQGLTTIWEKALELSVSELKYLGTSFTATNTLNGTTKDLQIRGKTYQNLARLDLDASELFSNTDALTIDDNIVTIGEGNALPYYKGNLNMYKASAQYTLVVNVLENTLDDAFRICNTGYSTRIPVFSTSIDIPVGKTGISKYLLTTIDDVIEANIVLRSTKISTTEGSITYSFMILEGDYTQTDLPPTITGIESTEVSEITIETTNEDETVSDTLTIELDEAITLNQVGDTRDWIDWESGEIVREVGMYLVDEGTLLSLAYVESQSDGDTILVRIGTGDTLQTSKIISNNFRFFSSPVSNLDEIGVYNSSGFSTQLVVWARLNKSDIVSNDLDGAKTWFADNPTTFYYQLATPTREPLPESIITQLRNLDTYNTTTHAYLTTDSNVPAELYAQIPTDEVGMADFEDVKDALEDLGVAPTEYANVNKDMLTELGVEI